MKPENVARRFIMSLAAAAMAVSVLIAPSHVFAQSRDDYGRGLTGDPLVDSILQAPGPDFTRGEPRRNPEDLWEQDRRSYTPPRRDARETVPRSAPDEDWRDDDPPRSTQDDLRAPDPAPQRRVRRAPPPPPAQRGDGPSDIIILDSEPAEALAGRGEPNPSEPEAVQAEQAEAGDRDLAEGQPEADVLPEDQAEPGERPQRDTNIAARSGRQDDTADRAQEREPYREAPARSDASEPPPASERRVAALPSETAAAPPAVPAKAPDRQDVSPALNKMIGQMLLIGFRGQTPSDPGVRRVADQLKAGKAGGVIFMSRNIESPQQVRNLTRLFAAAAKDQPTLFIGVDQEGGYVQRLARSKGFNTHPSAERLGARNDPQGAYSTYRKLALELRDYGFNLNFGPVVDLNVNPANPVIGRLKRSFGTDPDHVASFAKAFVFAHNETGVLTVAKHFPGHGSSETDSHDELVDISKSWSEAELRPYRKLIEANAIDMIMTGHLYHPSLSDGQGVPVSLSRRGIHTVLRESLNFDGVVITDDLDMRGVRESRTFEDAVISAAAAGNDILLITNANGYMPDLPGRAAAAIRNGLDEGRLSVAQIEESYQRVLKLKEELSRLQRTATGRGEDRGLADHSGG